MNNQETQMHKVQLVIRNAFLVLTLFLLGNNLHSQEKVNGKYCINFALADNYDCIEFNGNLFSRTIGADLGNDYYGNGTFTVRDNLLILNYNKTELKNSSGYYRSKFWKNKSDKIQLTFEIKNLNNSPIFNALVAIVEEKNGTNTNNKGIAELFSGKSNVKKEISISFLGYEGITIPILGNLNYHFDVYLKESDNLGIPIKNQIDTLKIKEMGKDYFIIFNKEKKEILWKRQQ